MGELEFHFCISLYIGGTHGRPSHPYIESATALSDREEEEYSDLPACRISETVSSLVLKLGLHIVVSSSRLDNHSQ